MAKIAMTGKTCRISGATTVTFMALNGNCRLCCKGKCGGIDLEDDRCSFWDWVIFFSRFRARAGHCFISEHSSSSIDTECQDLQHVTRDICNLLPALTLGLADP